MRAKEFAKYLLDQVNNHSLYIWGGQGELLDRMSLKTIREMETSEKNFATILEKYAACVKNGADMSKARAYDCSGLGVYFLLKYDIIKSDATANDLYNLCPKKVKVGEAREGDFVFKNQTDGKWGHVGYVVKIDGVIKVVEAKGRAYGVVISSIDNWKAAGRPNWWDAEQYIFTRGLKKGMTGDDVQNLQELLNAAGYNLVEDRAFGSKTDEAVRDYQRLNNLAVDGVAGKKTVTKLGGIWE